LLSSSPPKWLIRLTIVGAIYVTLAQPLRLDTMLNLMRAGYIVSWLGGMASGHPISLAHYTMAGAMASRVVATSHRGEELLLVECFIQISDDPKVGSNKKNDTFWYKILDVYNEEAKKNNYPPRIKKSLTGKWTPMNRYVQKFNSLVLETSVMGGENDEDWMTRVEILYKTHMGSDFKHKSAWLFLEDKHKWKNPESTLARRNRLRVTDEEPEHFEEDVLPRPPWAQRIAKSQRSSNSTASSGSNPAMFQEMMQQQYELDRKAKMKVIE
ncbi:hypothetical protein Tco_0736832, partial [Tanacetum coccineum]